MAEHEDGQRLAELFPDGGGQEQHHALAQGAGGVGIKSHERDENGRNDRVDDDRRYCGEHACCQHPFGVTTSDVDAHVSTGDGPPCKHRGCKADEPRREDHQQGEHQRPDGGSKHHQGQEAHG